MLALEGFEPQLAQDNLLAILPVQKLSSDRRVCGHVTCLGVRG